MPILYRIIKIILFVVFLAFAARNADSVTVRGFFGYAWQLPLVFILLIFFGAGILLGITAGLGQFVRQRRAIVGLKKELRRHANDADAT